MYSLLSGLVKYVLKKDEYCVLIIGLDNAGKTTLLEQVNLFSVTLFSVTLFSVTLIF